LDIEGQKLSSTLLESVRRVGVLIPVLRREANCTKNGDFYEKVTSVKG